MIASAVILGSFSAIDWPRVCAIYLEGILSGNATFESEPPSWDQFDRTHLQVSRICAWADERFVGWGALSPISERSCYSGVAEVSLYVAEAFRGQGIGRLLLNQIIQDSEDHGIWTLQGSVFPENLSSLKMCFSCGFRQIGRRKHVAKLNGLWRDTLLLERRSGRVGVI